MMNVQLRTPANKTTIQPGAYSLFIIT